MPTRVRARRGAAFYVGLGLVLAGLALLGYVAWQFLGTNVVSERKQRSLVEKTEQTWRTAPTGDRATSGAELPGTADALIRIPRFGRDYVMPVQEGVSDSVLAEGF